MYRHLPDPMSVRRFATFLVSTLVIAGASAGQRNPGMSGTGSWHSRPEMLQARAAHAVVSTGNAIYALAGTGPDGPVLDVERFDGRRWTHETRLPGNGLNAPAAVVLDGRIYLIGGFNTTTNVVESYTRRCD
jgi:N-acetylneuraminic acid mutarotase